MAPRCFYSFFLSFFLLYRVVVLVRGEHLSWPVLWPPSVGSVLLFNIFFIGCFRVLFVSVVTPLLCYASVLFVSVVASLCCCSQYCTSLL